MNSDTPNIITKQLSETSFFNNSLANYALVLLIVGTGVFVFHSIKRISYRYIISLKKSEEFTLIDVLIEILSLFSWPLYLILSINIALPFLSNQDPRLQDNISFGIFVIGTIYISLVIKKVISLAIQSIIKNRTFQGEDPNFDPSGLRFLEFGINIIVWVVAGLFILQNRNININALVGGLGVAGVAFAIGLQNILGDLFASVSIYTDKPFVIGDHIQIGDEIGEVVKIGLKTTRIKTLKGEELVVSNKELSNTKIKNLTRISKRKVFMEVKIVKSETEYDLENIPKQLQDLTNKLPKVKFYGSYLKQATDKYYIFSLEFDVNKVAYKDFLAIQNSVGVDILELFGEENVEFNIL